MRKNLHLEVIHLGDFDRTVQTVPKTLMFKLTHSNLYPNSHGNIENQKLNKAQNTSAKKNPREKTQELP